MIRCVLDLIDPVRRCTGLGRPPVTGMHEDAATFWFGHSLLVLPRVLVDQLVIALCGLCASLQRPQTVSSEKAKSLMNGES